MLASVPARSAVLVEIAGAGVPTGVVWQAIVKGAVLRAHVEEVDAARPGEASLSPARSLDSTRELASGLVVHEDDALARLATPAGRGDVESVALQNPGRPAVLKLRGDHAGPVAGRAARSRCRRDRPRLRANSP